MFYATFNNVSVIYQSFAVGRGFRRLMFYDTFKNVSVIGGSCFMPLSIMFQLFTTPLL
jgi:hypothetical protein